MNKATHNPNSHHISPASPNKKPGSPSSKSTTTIETLPEYPLPTYQAHPGWPGVPAHTFEPGPTPPMYYPTHNVNSNVYGRSTYPMNNPRNMRPTHPRQNHGYPQASRSSNQYQYQYQYQQQYYYDHNNHGQARQDRNTSGNRDMKLPSGSGLLVRLQGLTLVVTTSLYHLTLMALGDEAISSMSDEREQASPLNATIQTWWYPKLTPYRLLTVLVGVGLGTLKAILVSQGRELASVGLEWVLGTIVVIIFFLLSTYENDLRKDESATMWFFDYDCMNVCWKLVSLIGVEPPSYSTHERRSLILNLQDSSSPGTPMITNYHFLVSGIITVFGMAKAALSYSNMSHGATVLDWIYGVIITTLLYILSLYEKNPNKIFCVLFDRDDSPVVVYVGKEGGVVLFLLALASVPMISVPYLSYTVPQVDARLKADLTDNGPLKDSNLLLGIAFRMMVIETIAIGIYLSLFPLILAGKIMKRYFQSPSGRVMRLWRYMTWRICRVLGLTDLEWRQQIEFLITRRIPTILLFLNSILLRIFILVFAVSSNSYWLLSMRDSPDIDGIIDRIEANTLPQASLRNRAQHDEDREIRKMRWHPKLTPFRVLTLSICMGLGIAKAVLTYRGFEFAPVAVEWILGTVLFLVFYFLGISEQDNLNDDSKSWFYDYDCMNLIWQALRACSIEPPEYSNFEAPFRGLHDSRRVPVITNYRLLVSLIVFASGMLKAVLTYTGQSSGATAVDWISGVVVATILYILGLYESNPTNRFPTLFVQDSSPLAVFVAYEGTILACLILLATLSTLGCWLAWDIAVRLYNRRTEPINLHTTGGIAELFADIMIYSCVAFFGYASTAPFFLVLFFSRRYRNPSGVMYRCVTSLARRCGLAWIFAGSGTRAHSRYEAAAFTLRVANHILLHTFGLVFVAFGCLQLLWLGSHSLGSDTLLGIILLFFSLPTLNMTIYLSTTLLRPFIKLRRLRTWRGQENNLGLIF
ncbi:hypothetical protein CVT24_012418 [Panaeolus cyanescens]|uniref:Transmembrane protein n=1 Tax=Panaeolus cyanescens TaxID=181874 RepID=A0A409YJF2_9AGAR|nr:hypothetical protein CVT24_012418 [Panaeolus cyanescens]